MQAKRYNNAYFSAFLCALVLCWSPFNLLAYLAPLISVTVFLLLSRSHTVMRNVVLWFVAWGIVVSFSVLLIPGFVLHSALLSVLTYGSFLVVLAFPGQFIASSDLLNRLLHWARFFVIVEAVIGITQAIYGFSRTGSFDIANGDFVEGTIHLALASERSLSNPMFAINVAFLLLAILPDLVLRRRGYLAVVLGGIALILASVLHVLLMLVAAGAVALLLYRPIAVRRRMTYLGAIGLLAAVIFSFFALRRNLSTAEAFARQLVSGQSYRSEAIRRVMKDMPHDYPLLPLVGIGPGQFSSRAGLIGTGLYFGGPVFSRPIPFVPQGMSRAFRENTLDLWVAHAQASVAGRGIGSTHLPFLSWLSVYVEWGILVLAAFFVVVAYLLIRVSLVARDYPQRVLASAFGAGLLLILFLGAQENYWEVPQAILVGIMLLKVQHAVLMSPRQLRAPAQRPGGNRMSSPSPHQAVDRRA